ncbi:hypothetical protein [Streptomyces sp. P9-A2]|uniref:hypothetical protein n=1 Tax=Streptomyces sp. P9-A2 TaxID=3072284 RepID=UPI002FC82A61
MVRGLRHVMEANERYDAFVVPPANAFRPAFQTSPDRLPALECRSSKPGEKD